MADPKIVTEWLSKADEDFDFAAMNLENPFVLPWVQLPSRP